MVVLVRLAVRVIVAVLALGVDVAGEIVDVVVMVGVDAEGRSRRAEQREIFGMPRYGFGLADAGFDWRAAWLGAGASGYVLWRDVSELQPRVDPGAGLRIYGESRFALFQRDLGVVVRGEGAGVGSREGEFSRLRLPGYLTLGASVSLTLADATFTFRARNLENRRREEVWVDPITGVEALGPGREFRFTLAWRLFD